MTLTTDQVTCLYGQTVTLFAYLKRSDAGVRLAGAPIRFSIDGDYLGTAKVDAYGNYARLKLPASAVARNHVGTHTITARYDGSSSFGSAQATNRYIVYQSTPTISGSNVSGTTGTVTARMVDRYTSAALAGRRIEVTIDHRCYATFTTDSAGRIRSSYRIPQTHGHPVKYAFAGDTDYRSATGSATITGT